jgi:thymidylate synthase (FAD)
MTQIKATYENHMGSDLSVVNAARVSFGKKSAWNWSKELESGTGNGNTLKAGDTKLINYLAKHGHISPFGHCFASFHVKAPIFVARQLVKHKFLRWNEISRRYVDDEPEFYTPDVWRGRSADKKQGSEGAVNPEYNPQYLDSKIKFAYLQALDMGVAPEQARMLLPQSTLTEWIWSGSLDAFADMCRLRCKSDTQYESRVVADQVSTIMQDLYPVSWAALMEGETG